jgi:putative DNA primase/helicase
MSTISPEHAEALRLHEAGFWSHAIHPNEKRPIGNGWGLNRWQRAKLDRTFKSYPGAGCGIAFGTARSPDGRWLIDVEGDGDDAEPALANLCGGELVQTMGWSSARGSHRLFCLDHDHAIRLLEIVAAYGEEGTGIKKGVWHLPSAPGLEFRIGGFKDDGAVKQVQSVCPPTLGTDGKPREWNGCREVAEWPSAATDRLEQLGREAAEAKAAEQKATAEQAAEKPDRKTKGRTGKTVGEMTALDRARAYLAKVDPAVSGKRGHDTTFRAACKVGPGFDLTEEECYGLLLREFNPRCDPPWTSDEIAHKVDDAYKNETRRGWLLKSEWKGANHRTNAEGEEVNEANDDPHRLARIFLDRFKHPDGPTLAFYSDEFYTWLPAAGHWELYQRAELQAELARAIKREFDRVNAAALAAGMVDDKGNPVKASKVTRAVVENATLALKGEVVQRSMIELPAWLDPKSDDLSPADLLPAPNGLASVKAFVAGRFDLIKPTPRFFNQWALDYPIDPHAPEPLAWKKFLHDVWQDDHESQNALQEWFGYCLVRDTSQHKIMLIVGPTRSGKGVICRCLKSVISANNVAGPTLAGLATNFGLESLIGKPVAIVADARLSGKTDQSIITERLLSISGEDTLTIDRKYRQAWIGRLPTRLVITSNELPGLVDRSNALATRLVILPMVESFKGREDHGLESKIHAERAGILRWAIDGLARLRKRGHFVQPKSGLELVNEMEDLSSPIKAFLRDACDVGPEHSIEPNELFIMWKLWCEKNGREHPGDVQRFGRDLRTALPGLRTSNRRNPDDSRVRFFEGVGRKQDDAPPY